MKKLLIIGSSEAVRKSAVRAIGTVMKFDEIKAVPHEQALGEFLTWEPSHVLLFDYSERDRKALGRQTWRDLQGAATGNERMVRCGLENYDYPDFIRLPFLLVDLMIKFQGEEDTQ